jgi:hypothetical protein
MARRHDERIDGDRETAPRDSAGGQEKSAGDRQYGYWGGRETWRNPGDFGTQGRWGTHLNWTGAGRSGPGC